MIFVPRRRACLKNELATGWFAVGLEPVMMTTSALATSAYVVDTAPEPMPSNSAATEEAWQSRVQWSTLLVPKPARMSFWKRYASSFEHFAEPNPAIAAGPPLGVDLQSAGGRPGRAPPPRSPPGSAA